VMYQRQECIARAAVCRKKAQDDPAHHDYWIDEAIGWLQRAIPTARKNDVSHEIRGGRLIPKRVH
jgi:hypothetical protein